MPGNEPTNIYTGYCVKCRVNGRIMKDAKEVSMKGKGGVARKAATGSCEKCGTKMYKILPKNGGQH